MIDVDNARSDEQIIKDSFDEMESMIHNVFIYYLNTDLKCLKTNIKIQKLETKMRKICTKYIKKYLKLKGYNV